MKKYVSIHANSLYLWMFYRIIMLTFPNAKINLGLNIVEKRSDGFHNIETVFYPINLCDALEFVEKEKGADADFSLSGIRVDGNLSNNLVMKAYDLLRVDFGLPPLSIYLQKNIPLGAGLGGGSADAAFMLKSLNQYFALNLSIEQLEAYALRLGSDCPFFINNKPMFARGRGEELTPVALSLQGYHLVLVKPEIHVSTADAYSACNPHFPEKSLQSIASYPVSTWKDCMCNDFEKNIFEKHPQIKSIKEKLYQQGAIYASMSGSGASVYGIFEQEIDIQNQYSHCFVWKGKF